MWMDFWCRLWLIDCLYVALDLLHSHGLLPVYLSSSTCCLEWQVESPSSLGTICHVYSAPWSWTSWLSPIPSPSLQTSRTCWLYHIPDSVLVRMTQSLCPSPVTLDSTSSFTTEPWQVHNFGSRDQSPKNDHIFITSPGYIPGFKGRVLVFCKEGQLSPTNRGIPVYCKRGRYYEAYAENNQVVIGGRHNDIEAYNYPRDEISPPPGFSPVTIQEGSSSSPRARYEQVFEKLRTSSSHQSNLPG